MKEIRLEVFDDLNDALYFLEVELWDLALDHEDVKGEVSLIDGKWRVGVIINTRQLELFDGMIEEY